MPKIEFLERKSDEEEKKTSSVEKND